FLQNLTVAVTGITNGAAVISLPRSQVEMTPFDLEWQERITKVVRRVAKDLIANDEAEISEVVRRRLFEDLGSEQVRKEVARVFADWCFERRAQLPPEWTAVDTATTEAKAKEFLRRRFAACYPFHPATLSVFQRKWQALPQYQQTRGTLAMLAQWIAIAAQEGFRKARPEPLITLGSAPLFDPGFRSTLLGQLGESRLVAAIEADIAGEHSHARALDADAKGPLRDIHYRVGTAILFESSGGQSQRVAHLPELRFALGEPGLDTTSIDTAAFTLEDKSYFIRRVGADGFQIYYRPTLKKVVNDRRASLDPETEVKPAMRKLIEEEFRRHANIPVLAFPADGAEVGNTTKLTLVVLDPSIEWTGNGPLRARLAEWIRYQGRLPRLYPASLIWCLKKPGRDLREKVEVWLAWRRVAQEVAQGILGEEFERNEIKELQLKTAAAEEAAKEQVWADYRFIALTDNRAPEGMKVIDLGAGHANSGETIATRVLA
ncbi:MAG: ATP-binding protein, partial [Firmicutes bacterium]|nr:ATP-binding protein [Bacillota bacterium]